jgi:hypothetical protein
MDALTQPDWPEQRRSRASQLLGFLMTETNAVVAATLPQLPVASARPANWVAERNSRIGI